MDQLHKGSRMELVGFRPSETIELVEDVIFGSLILSCCPCKPHVKAGNEKKEKKKFCKPLKNEYSSKSQNHHVVDDIFNQLVMQENVFSSDFN